MSYIKTWENRCYSNGIPDEIPVKLANSGRVPSYKMIAISILKNDLTLKGLGFDGKYTNYYKELKSANKDQLQKDLF